MAGYNNSDLSSSVSFARSFMANNYAGGEVRVSGTTASKNLNKASANSLSSRNVADYLNGNYMNRKPVFNLVSFDNHIHSSLNSQLIGGAEVGHGYNTANDEVNPNLTVLDPNSINTADIQRLSGGAAFAELLKRSAVSRNLTGDLVSNAIDGLNSAYLRSLNDGVMLGGNPHDRETYTYTNIELVGATGRAETGGVALQSVMSQDEIGWISDRMRLLKGYGVIEDDHVLNDGFDFDIPDHLSDLQQNYGLNNERRYSGGVLDETVQRSGVETAYLAPALIELLIYLGSDESEVRIVANTGAGSSPTSQETGANVSTLSNGDMVSDHVFGRAIDIVSVTNVDGSGGAVDLPSSGSSVAIYRAAFELLMDELNKVGLSHPYLLPDSICVSSGLKAELEIEDGSFEVSNASVRLRYPGLKYVDFVSSDYATGYIHLSFGAGRCGVYSGPGTLSMGRRSVNGSDSEFAVDLTSGVDSALLYIDGEIAGTAASFSDEKFNTPFIGDRKSESLTRDEVFRLLLNVMQPEAAAIFCAIAVREGGSKPGAFNPSNYADNDLPLPSATNPSVPTGSEVTNPSGVSFPLIATAQSIYDTAKTILDYPNPENRYNNSGGGNPTVNTVDSWTAADEFDCSGLVFWAAYKNNIAINAYSNLVRKVEDVSQFNSGWDWSYTQTIIDLMDVFGTKFVDSSGETVIGTDVPKPDYEKVFNTPGAVIIRGPDDIPGQGGHVAIVKGDGTRTILHAASTSVGLIEQSISEESLQNYWHCGLIPGTYSTTSSGATDSAGGSNLNYSVSDLGLHGDWSVGMFQVNLLPNAHGQKNFFLPSPAPGQVVQGWKIGLVNWQNYGTTTAALAGAKMSHIYKPYRVSGRHADGVEVIFDEVDERAWVPINQAYMLYKTATNRDPSIVMAEDQKAGRDHEYIFGPWGDYDGGPTYGFISNVRFETAVEIYVSNTTGTRQDLVDWTLQMFDNAIKSNGEPSPSKEHAEEWTQGWVFRSTYNSATSRYSDGGKEHPDVNL